VDRTQALDHPIRVVVFTGGHPLDRAVQRFVCRLAEHAEVDLVGVVSQSESSDLRQRIRGQYRRRGMLGTAAVLMHEVNARLWALRQPRSSGIIRRQIASLAGRIHFAPDIHAPDILSLTAALQPDLGLIYGGPILTPALFGIPRLGTLGIHHGKVPAYRGKKTIFWSVFNGERTAGVTIQRVNAGIDAGHVVKEAEVEIGAKSLGQVRRELEDIGIDLYVDAVVEMRQGTARPRPQSGTKGRLYRDPRFSDLVRFYGRDVKRRWTRLGATLTYARKVA
jgi:methionyl-tRNA formyltransferase